MGYMMFRPNFGPQARQDSCNILRQTYIVREDTYILQLHKNSDRQDIVRMLPMMLRQEHWKMFLQDIHRIALRHQWNIYQQDIGCIIMRQEEHANQEDMGYIIHLHEKYDRQDMGYMMHWK